MFFVLCQALKFVSSLGQNKWKKFCCICFKTRKKNQSKLNNPIVLKLYNTIASAMKLLKILIGRVLTVQNAGSISEK